MMNRKAVIDQYDMRLFVFTVALVVAVSLIFGGCYVFAKTNDTQTTSYKYFTSIQIEEGDTLWKLATSHLPKEYNSVSDYVNEIKDLNALKSDSIHAGQYLMIPYYSDQVK